jgi:hypothetical protein
VRTAATPRSRAAGHRALEDGGGGELSDEELADLIDGLEDGDEDGELAALVDSLTDEELAGLEAEALADDYGGGDTGRDGYGQEELAEFGAAFSNTYAAEEARPRQDAEPAIRRATSTSPTEDRLARAFERIAAGTYTPSYGLANQRVALELANQGGA